jgi:hypothetical protein
MPTDIGDSQQGQYREKQHPHRFHLFGFDVKGTEKSSY